MDFLVAPAIIAILMYGFYKILELYVRRRERLAMIERCSESNVDVKQSFRLEYSSANFVPLRIGVVFLGLGLGLIIGFIIQQSVPDINVVDNLKDLILGASTLIFGGLALIVEFIVERRLETLKNKE